MPGAAARDDGDAGDGLWVGGWSPIDDLILGIECERGVGVSRCEERGVDEVRRVVDEMLGWSCVSHCEGCRSVEDGLWSLFELGWKN